MIVVQFYEADGNFITGKRHRTYDQTAGGQLCLESQKDRSEVSSQLQSCLAHARM